VPSGFTRWPWWRRWFGRKAERTAALFLCQRGYRLLAANVDDRQGELDLLAIDGLTLVVVEVRSSESRTVEELAATVDLEKQRRITDATTRFLSKRKLLAMPVRFDVLAIRWPPGGKPEIRHYIDAFPASGRNRMF
jgi:putative endonuclease